MGISPVVGYQAQSSLSVSHCIHVLHMCCNKGINAVRMSVSFAVEVLRLRSRPIIPCSCNVKHVP